MSQRRLAFKGSLLICAIGTVAIAISYTSRGPDYDLEFRRELKSEATPEQLGAALDDFKIWPRWFHSLSGVKVVGAEKAPVSGPQVGQELALEIDPRKGPSRRFVVYARVAEYQPGKRIALSVSSDSKGRLTKMFDRVDWTVEVNPGPSGKMLILGQQRAHTSHWRARFFGRLSDKILSNQIFYPDLFKLAKIHRPADDSLPQIE